VLSLLGTYLGIEIQGAYANIRAIGAVVGGFLGGPIVGIGAGLIGGLHRFFLGGFTSFACALATSLAGLIGGLVYYYRPLNRISLKEAFSVGVIVEVIEMAFVLIFSEPYSAAYGLVKVIALPMIFSNALGIVLFVDILQKSFRKEEEAKARQAHKALKIANNSLCYLSSGLDYDSAAETAKIILEITDVAAVAITDRSEVLAHSGLGEDHHHRGSEILTDATKLALERGELNVVNTTEDVGCPVEDCPLGSAVIVPLKQNQTVIGTLKLYKRTEQGVTDVDIALGQGIGELLSTQLYLSRLKKEAQLTAEAELKALQAQIHPHFLFNSLNTIVSFCRTDPEQARKLLMRLSKFFRKTLTQNTKIVTLEQELEYVEDYITIEKARFGDKLTVEIEIADELLNHKIPSFTLQPIIENAIKHGLAPQAEAGRVEVEAKEEESDLVIKIRDDGVGIAQDELEDILDVGKGKNVGIGLSNVDQRLEKIYGSQYGVELTSALEEGTEVVIKMPIKEEQVIRDE
ncbi:MAG: sensor histidine kinase, partial [Halanaerobacter sp.]